MSYELKVRLEYDGIYFSVFPQSSSIKRLLSLINAIDLVMGRGGGACYFYSFSILSCFQLLMSKR